MIRSKLIKKIGYRLLDILTLKKGIPVRINGLRLKLPTYYFRLFPADYEKDNFNYIQSVVQEGDWVLDIGAHIGLMAVVLGTKVKPGGRVFSFEPTPASYKILCQTVSINGLGNIVKPVNAAVSDSSGQASFYISDTAVDVGNSLVKYGNDKVLKPISIAMISIDDFVKKENINRLDFLKIDAEGVEYKVLKGGMQTLSKFRPRIILALHPEAIRANGDSQEEIYTLIKEAGYTVMYEGKELDKTGFCCIDSLFDVHLIPGKAI